MISYNKGGRLMKKLLSLGAIFVGALLLTGCGDGNKYTCSVTVTESGESMTQKVVTHLDKDDKVESYDMVFEMASEDSAKTIYEMYKTVDGAEVSRSGKTVTIKDAQKIEGNEMDLIGKTKDEVKEYLLDSAPDATCK